VSSGFANPTPQESGSADENDGSGPYLFATRKLCEEV
jgi:hypothetical protein